MRKPARALIGYVLEDDAIGRAEIAARRGLSSRQRSARGHNDDVRFHVANVWNDFDADAVVVEGIHQIDPGAQQFALGFEHAVPDQQHGIGRLQKPAAKKVNG
jgi:hypothetical protein